MDNLFEFVKDNLVWVLLGVVVLGAVISFIKSVVRWLLTVIIVLGFLIYGFNYTPEPLKAMADELVTNTKSSMEDKAIAKLMTLTDVKYKQDKKGTYTISGGGIVLTGSLASKTSTLKVSGQSFNIPVTPVLDSFIATQKKLYDSY